jgi:probable poly-beta-1,6-N-acetyl-D-glucosamine export protein
MKDSLVRSEKKLAIFAKGLAILAVIFLHSLSSFLSQTIYAQSKYQLFFIGLNQICRFSVPLFLALSGFGLARKYQKQTFLAKKFIADRAKKLLPLYLVWSFILMIIFNISRTWYGEGISFWPGILTGQIDYHLYFVPLIFQFYLFFLFLPTIKNRYHLFLLLIGVGLVQIGWLSLVRFWPNFANYNLNKFFLDDQRQYRLLTNWLFYFVFGYFLAQINLTKASSNKKIKNFLEILTAVGFFWAIYDSHLLIEKTGNVIYSTGFNRLPIFFYAIGFIGWVIIFGPNLNRKILNFWPLSFLGRHSYLIYLSHTLILRTIEGLLVNDQRLSTLTTAVVLVSAGIFLSRSVSSG